MENLEDILKKGAHTKKALFQAVEFVAEDNDAEDTYAVFAAVLFHFSPAYLERAERYASSLTLERLMDFCIGDNEDRAAMVFYGGRNAVQLDRVLDYAFERI